MKFFNIRQWPLHYQLTLSVMLLVLFLSGCFAALSLWSVQKYHDEKTQRLYSTLAAYIIDHQKEPLFKDNEPNVKALKQIAMHTMAINPLVEVYLLSPEGNILAHDLPAEYIKLSSVDLAPVKKRILQMQEEDPVHQKTGGIVKNELRHQIIYGDDPRNTGERRLFSARALHDAEGKMQGYLYVVLNSQVEETIAEQIQDSYYAQLIIFAIVALTLFALAMGSIIFFKLTSPIRELTQELSEFQQSSWMESDTLQRMNKGAEIPALKSSFVAMKLRIISQFKHLQETSRLRRELISNVSHDLRTPLASLQGYIEALMIKRDKLSEKEQEKYLNTAHRNSVRLTRLVGELFELSKLESGQIKPEMESFSLLELIYDIVQDYDLTAAEKNIQLQIHAVQKPYQVAADISLIHRVLQNLIDNALRFTPEGGHIDIELKASDHGVEVIVADSGFGIHEQDLPHIFEAYYSTNNNPNAEAANQRKEGTGLGLAIVKRILELHNSQIAVKTEAGHGTRFYFELAVA